MDNLHNKLRDFIEKSSISLRNDNAALNELTTI